MMDVAVSQSPGVIETDGGVEILKSLIRHVEIDRTTKMCCVADGEITGLVKSADPVEMVEILVGTVVVAVAVLGKRNLFKASLTHFAFPLSKSVDVVVQARMPGGRRLSAVVTLALPLKTATRFTFTAPIRIHLEKAELDGTGLLRLVGWAIALSNLVTVKISSGGVTIGTVDPVDLREDVAAAYPSFPNAITSGFATEFRLPGALARRIGRVKAQAFAIDGSSQAIESRVRRVAAFEPMPPPAKESASITFHCDSLTLTVNGWLSADGWATSPVGVSRIAIQFDGKAVGDAQIGRPRADVGGTHPELRGAENAGFEFTAKVAPGGAATHSVAFRIETPDGGVRVVELEVTAAGPSGDTAPPPQPPASPEPEAQHRRFAMALSAWGRSAFEALPAFVEEAFAAQDPGTFKRSAAANLNQTVAQICKSFPMIELPFLDEPLCSIIIPAYNHFECTYRCIKSLVETGATELAEVILADDVSDDAVIFLGSIVTNLRVSRNPENLGFLRNCNRAARLARGKFLLFLNNDTIARPGWLQKCLATFDQFENVGVVGSKLLYEDGTLQDAGGIVWNDGSAWNFGNRADGEAPEYNYVREVDYVTGASLAIRRALFDSLGGFDEAYAPAYCEDSDLCLKVSSAGWRVLYQPFSELIHIEGKSHGQDVSKGLKAYQTANSEKLYQRWHGYIADNGPNAYRPWFNKDRRHIGRALVVDVVTPTPERDAGSIATYEQMLILRDLGYKISFIPEGNFAHVGAPTLRLQEAGIECVYGPYIRSVDEWLQNFGDSLDVIHVYRYDVLIKHWDTIKGRAPHAKLVYANADMHSLRIQRQAALNGDVLLATEAKRIKKLEIGLHRQADCSIVTSDYEVELLNAAAPGTAIKLIRWINEVAERNPAPEGRDCIAFLGGYQHPPNVDAVDYFMEDILPKVVALTPQTKFLICGSAMPERFHNHAGPNVEIIGFVSDLAPLFNRCLATVAPLRFGAGFKGKVATSLSFGVPCIGTAIAREGMGLGEGDGFVEVASPEGFATAIATIYSNPNGWRQLAQQGIAAVDRLYSRRAAMTVWAEMLSELGLPARVPEGMAAKDMC